MQENPGDINFKLRNIMKKVFKRVVLTANENERFVFDFIIHRFEFYDCYYGNFAMLRPVIKSEEYSTLRQDLEQYNSSVIQVYKSVDVKFIQSFKRSCQLLRGRIGKYPTHQQKEFINFLDYCVQNLDSMVDRFIDEILASLD